MVKYTRMVQVKMHRFLSKNYFSLEDVSPKNSDLTVNNAHSQSSVSFSTNKSVTTPDTTQNLEDVIDSHLGGVHSATSIIQCVKTPSLHTEGIRPSVGAKYLARGNFICEEGA